jgi:hypothetical protein
VDLAGVLVASGVLLGVLISIGGCPSGDTSQTDLDALVQQAVQEEVARVAAGTSGGTSGAAGATGLGGAVGATGPEGPAGPEGPTGLSGPQGAAGADGQLRIYGSADAPSVTLTDDLTLWYVDPPESTLFNDLTIAAGKTLIVPSGTVIRCAGTFTNHGTLRVTSSARGGVQFWEPGTGNVYVTQGLPAESGLAPQAAANGECGDNTHDRSGALATTGVYALEIPMLPGNKGGGGGGGAVYSPGGPGGGTLVVLARAGITNSAGAEIFADIDTQAAGLGAGGGGGGIVILASPGSIVQAGAIRARGGAGGDNGDNNWINIGHGAGGGGGGGFVHLISPTIDDAGGTVDVAGGAAGAHGFADSIDSTVWQGGAAGGACRGMGGGGGNVSVGAAGHGTPTAAYAGGAGEYLKTVVDPTPLF